MDLYEVNLIYVAKEIAVLLYVLMMMRFWFI
jgi:hypothetical protein